MSGPPSRPWKRGKQKDYTGAFLELRLVEDENGWVYSEHEAATPEDEEALSHMKSGGVHAVAYALMTEALRRETFECLLVEMTRHPDIIEWCDHETYREKLIKKLSGAALATVMGLAQKMLPDLARETVFRVSEQAKSSRDG